MISLTMTLQKVSENTCTKMRLLTLIFTGLKGADICVRVCSEINALANSKVEIYMHISNQPKDDNLTV